jgi:NAD(P)-dependent dehydrogenase (short-subunit alcohol dehydrogenase family)
MAERFDGQTVLVTGAGRGLGRATALELARLGANVVACSRRAEDLTETARAAEALGAATLAEPLDVTDRAALEALVRRAEARFGAIDALVNNAGVIEPVAPLWRTDPELWLRNIEINLGGPFLAARTVLPGMLARRRGAVINVSSGAGLPQVRNFGWTAYSAAKAGLDHLTRVLARELDGSGVWTVSFEPGLVDTPMQTYLRQVGPEEFSPENVARFRRFHDEGLLRDPAVPARAIAWLATDEAAGLHGEVVGADDPRVQAGAATLAPRRG